MSCQLSKDNNQGVATCDANTDIHQVKIAGLISSFLFLYPNMGDFPKYEFAIIVCFFVSFVYIVFSFLCVKIIGIGGSKLPLIYIQ